MRLSIVIGCFLLCTSLQGAISQNFRTVESASGQILVRWMDQFRVPPYLTQDEVNAGIIVLSPELVTVSAERIKTGVLLQLGMTDRWRGKIRFNFDSGKSNPNQFYVDSRRFTNGWRYQVTISPKIRREVWVRGCVALHLLEIANRMATERSAEVPIWLIEGITSELIQTALVDLSPSFTDQIQVGGTNPGLGRIIPTQQRQDPLIGTRTFLGRNVPVSVSELFFPTQEHINGTKKQIYQRSAHFFFRHLVNLRAGKASIEHFLASLSSHLNWQQAFFPSFQEHFSSMLEVEKWWSVALTDLTQLAPISSWTVAASLSYLDRILMPAALVGQQRDEIAQRQNFTLQKLIAQWNYNDQRPTLERIQNRLRVLSIYAAPSLRPVIQGYQEAVSTYLSKRREVGFEPRRRGQTRLRADQVVSETQGKLNKLDTQRQALRPKAANIQRPATSKPVATA